MEQRPRMAIPFQVANMGHKIEQVISCKMVCRRGLAVRTPAVSREPATDTAYRVCNQDGPNLPWRSSTAATRVVHHSD